MEKWYTVQIQLHQGHEIAGKLVHEFKDFDDQRRAALQQRIWNCGWSIPTAPKAWEHASPFIISRVLIFEQDKKYSI